MGVKFSFVSCSQRHLIEALGLINHECCIWEFAYSVKFMCNLKSKNINTREVKSHHMFPDEVKQILIFGFVYAGVLYSHVVHIFMLFVAIFIFYYYLAMPHNLWALNSSWQGIKLQALSESVATGIPCWFSVAPEHSAEVLSSKSAMCLPEKMCFQSVFISIRDCAVGF